MRRMILILAAALAIVPMAVSPASADEKADVMKTVKQYAASLSNGDKNAWTASCAAQAIIIDDFPPHSWQGANACGDWWNDNDAFLKKNGTTDQKAVLGEPRHIEVTGDRAYVVVPTTLTYKQNGKPRTETGAVLTVALQKVSAGWRIAGWAYSQGHVRSN